MENIVSDNLLPVSFKYPLSYTTFVADVSIDKSLLDTLSPWRFYHNQKGLNHHFQQLNENSKRILVPFARRKDIDDIACFLGDREGGDPPVIVIHYCGLESLEVIQCRNFLHWLGFILSGELLGSWVECCSGI